MLSKFGIIAAAGLASGAATAQNWVFDHDAGSGANAEFVVAAQGDGNESSQFTIINEDGAFTLKVEDGEVVEVTVDEVEVPNSWVHKTDDGWKLIDSDGETLVLFRAPKNTWAQAQWRGDQDGRIRVQRELAEAQRMAEQARRGIAVRRQQPKTMVGITYSEPGSELRGHLGLGDKRAIVVESIREGLPADKAGLKQFDVIVGIGDGLPGTGEALRKALSEREPGDKLKFVVIRNGEKKSFDLKLQEFDSKRLNILVPEVADAPRPLNNQRFPGAGQFEPGQGLERLRELENLFGNDGRIRFGDEGELSLLLEGILDDDRFGDMNERLEERMERYEETMAEYEEVMEDFADELEERLEERFEEMEERLESLIERLEERLD